MLKGKGYNILIPRCLRSLRRGGKWNGEVNVLFTSYIFVEFDYDITEVDYYTINKVPDVINILGMDGQLISLSDDEVSYIKMLSYGGKIIPILTLEEVRDMFGDNYTYDARQKRCKVTFDFMGKVKTLMLSTK